MREFWAFAALHHGVFTRAEARAHGVSDEQLKRMIRNSEAIRIAPSTYRLASHSDTWEVRARAAAVSTGGILSHTTSAYAWGLDGFTRSTIELTTSYDKPVRRDDLRIHRSRQFELRDEHELDGLPVTGPARTVLDLFAVLSPPQMRTALDAALRQKLVGWSDLYDTLDLHSEHGRDGCGKLRAFLEAVNENASIPDSGWNRKVGELLFKSGLPEPAYEHEIRTADGSFVARVDLAYPNKRIAIELDSVRWHMNQQSFERDPRRKNDLLVQGWRVLTFTWSDYIDHRRNLIDTVKAAYKTMDL